jgi:PAS domain S-box-containing protein
MKNSSQKPVIILHLEDSSEDAEMIAHQLESSGLNSDINLVLDRIDFIQAIKLIKPDIILSDFELPTINGFEALTLAKKYAPDTPFIFVTGEMGEEMAVTTLKAGATDFILKSNLERLLPAVTRALDENRITIERKKLYKALKEGEEKYRTLLENLPAGIFRISLSDQGRVVQGNRTMALMHGFDSVEQLLNANIDEFFFSEDDRENLKQNIIKNTKVKNKLIRLKKADGELFWGSISATAHFDEAGVPDWIDGIVEDVTDRIESEQERNRINEELDLLINSFQSIIIGVSANDCITRWNPSAEKIFGIKASDILGKRFYEADINWSREIIYEAIGNCIITGKSIRVNDMKFEDINGKSGILGLAINPLKSGGDELKGFMILGKDITEQRILETQSLQSTKLEAIGQLAAGVAHEINTPLQYVGDNLKFINKSFTGIFNMLDIYETAYANITDTDKVTDIIKQGEDMRKKIKLPFLLEQLPKALEQSLEGIVKVSSIVQSMKAFSHPGSGSKMPSDINRAIENTVTVSRNEWKYECDLQLDLDPDLTNVPCFESEFNQVILNLIVNAKDAIVEAKENNKIEAGLIIIRTTRDESFAIIRVEDNGGGIPDKIKDKIFDPFFTTKEVGKGTGQGLPISHSIIVEKHGGMLYVESETGRGTTFIIKLPLEDED